MEQPIEVLRRERCEAGRREGELKAQTMLVMSEVELASVRAETVQRIDGSTGLDHSFAQGYFYAAFPNTTLNILRQTVEGEAV